MAASVRGVLFDIDDTLVETTGIWQDTVEQVAAWCAGGPASGAGVGASAIASAYRFESERAWSNYAVELGSLGSSTKIRRQIWSNALRLAGIAEADKFVDELVERFARAQLDAIQPDPMLRSRLRQLRRYCTIGVCTNGRRVDQLAKLERLGVLDLLQVGAFGIDLGLRKPDPRLFTIAAEQVGHAVERCVMVGDDWELDIQGAMDCGMTPLWVSTDEPRNTVSLFRSVVSAIDALLAALSADQGRRT